VKYGADVLKLGLGALTGNFFLPITVDENVSTVAAQPGMEQIMNQMELKGSDAGKGRTSFGLFPKEVGMATQLLSLLGGGNFAFFNTVKTSDFGGNSTPLMKADILNSEAGPAMGIMAEALNKKAAIEALIADGCSATTAISQVTGVSEVSARKAVSLILLVVKSAEIHSSNPQMKGVDFVSPASILDMKAFGDSLEAGLQVTAASPEQMQKLSIDFFNKMESMKGHQFKNINESQIYTLSKINPDKNIVARLQADIKAGKVGASAGGYVIEKTTLGALGNKTTDGRVIAVNTVGVEGNTKVEAHQVIAPAGTEVYVLRKDGKVVETDGAVDLFFAKCHGNPGTVLRALNVEAKNSIVTAECPEINNTATEFNPNVGLIRAVSDTLNNGGETAKHIQAENLQVATEQANNRSPLVFRNVVTNFEKSAIFGRLSDASLSEGSKKLLVSNYLRQNNIAPGTTFLGISYEDHILELSKNARYRAGIEKIMASRTFTELAAVKTAFQSHTSVDIGLPVNSSSSSTNSVTSATAERISTTTTTLNQSKTSASVAASNELNSGATVLLKNEFDIAQEVCALRAVCGLPNEKLISFSEGRSSISRIEQGQVSVKNETTSETSKTENQEIAKPKPLEQTQEVVVDKPAPAAKAPGNEAPTATSGTEATPAPVPPSTAPGQDFDIPKPVQQAPTAEYTPVRPAPAAINPSDINAESGYVGELPKGVIPVAPAPQFVTPPAPIAPVAPSVPQQPVIPVRPQPIQPDLTSEGSISAPGVTRPL
jgi:hypothetical protein